MATRTGKITSYKRAYSGTHKTMESSLADAGYSRMPGTGVRILPFKEPSGKYRTGLDPEASYIKKLPSEQERNQEKARVEEELKRLTEMTGLDLSPTSSYYVNMLSPEFYGEETVARIVKLGEQNFFNLNDPYQAITFAWLRVHPEVAPSIDAIKNGKVRPDIMYFVDDEEWEAEEVYKENIIINKAISVLDEMSPSHRLEVAVLCGLPVGPSTKESVVYNELSKYIKDTTSKLRLQNVNMFDKFSKMKAENRKIRYIVNQAISLNIYRVKNYRVWEGENEIGKDVEDVVGKLSSTKHQDQLMALEEKIKQKRLLEV